VAQNCHISRGKKGLNSPYFDYTFKTVVLFSNFVIIAQVMIVPDIRIFSQIWRYSKYESKK
jgi:hypothetical protein